MKHLYADVSVCVYAWRILYCLFLLVFTPQKHRQNVFKKSYFPASHC